MAKETHQKGDWLAIAMDNLLKDNKFQDQFKPMATLTKSASTDTVEDIYKRLLELSTKFDNLGLNKSAEVSLKVAESFLKEAKEGK